MARPVIEDRLARLEDELFCTQLELATMAGLVLHGRLERWLPGFSTPELERDHVRRYEWAAARAQGKRVLDVACGAGRGTAMLAQAGAARATGLDIDPEIVRYARLRHSVPGAEFECADACGYLPADRFDLVVSFETIEHVPDVGRFLSGLAAVLSPGGELVVSTPISDWDHDASPANPFHIQEWGYPGFERVLSPQFRVAERWLQLVKEPRNYARRVCNALGMFRRPFEPGEVRPASDYEPLGRPGVKYRGFQILVCRPAGAASP